MNVAVLILWVLFYLLAPAGVIALGRRSPLVRRIGSILMMYILGLVAGNLLIYPFEGMAERLFPLQDALSSVTIPLALPLILFACHFKDWPLRTALTSLLVGLVSVVAMAVAGFLLFGGRIGEEAPAVAGMAVGVYTGGTPNLAAVKMMLGVKENLPAAQFVRPDRQLPVPDLPDGRRHPPGAEGPALPDRRSP